MREMHIFMKQKLNLIIVFNYINKYFIMLFFLNEDINIIQYKIL